MNRALWGIMASIAVVFICSCATTEAYTHEYRKHSTGISADEGVVILLNTFRSNDKSVESEGEEKSLEDSVKTRMMKGNPKLRSVSAKDFRRMVFPDKGFLDSPRSSEDLLSFFLRDPDAQSRVRGLGVRYLVIVNATSYQLKKKMDGAVGFPIGGFGGREWFESSSQDADVLDVKYLRESGSVQAACSGNGAWAAGCVGIFPFLIPFGYYHSPSCETKACSALGEGVMTFLIDRHTGPVRF